MRVNRAVKKKSSSNLFLSTFNAEKKWNIEQPSRSIAEPAYFMPGEAYDVFRRLAVSNFSSSGPYCQTD